MVRVTVRSIKYQYQAHKKPSQAIEIQIIASKRILDMLKRISSFINARLSLRDLLLLWLMPQ